MHFYQDVHLQAELCFVSHTTAQVQRGAALLHHAASPAGRSCGLNCTQIRSWNRSQRCHTPVFAITNHLLSSSQKGAVALSVPQSKFCITSPQLPKGGILRQLAVEIGNESLPFSLLEPSSLNHEKDWF